jgi:hypothetical protein
MPTLQQIEGDEGTKATKASSSFVALVTSTPSICGIAAGARDP